MACTQTLSGLTRDCLGSIGGVLEVLIANVDDVASITITSNKVTAITMAASAKFHRYALRRGNGSMTSEATVDATSGNQFYTTSVLMQFSRMETTKRVEIAALAQADTIAIVHDANGLYWLAGDTDHPLALAGGTVAQTGQASADRNGYDITLQNESPDLPVEILVGTGGVNIGSITA